MGTTSHPGRGRKAWALARRHHGVITRGELLALGFTSQAIRHRLNTGRLHRTAYRGIYVVGTPALTRKGRWYAAVRASGEEAVLSHGSGGAFWGFGVERAGLIEVSVPHGRPRRQPGVRAHRRHADLRDLFRVEDDIPVTDPALTLIDLSARLSGPRLERAISKADMLGV